LAEQEKFQFLTSAALELLTQAQKLAYLSDAMDARHGSAQGWSRLFTDEDLAPTPRPG
jgi:hypothetical protein